MIKKNIFLVIKIFRKRKVFRYNNCGIELAELKGILT